MQLETLKVFRDLVDSRSFSKAAQCNSISQSAVSQQIRGLEERFRLPLLERGAGRRIGLTPEGELVYQTAKEIVALYQTLQNRIAEVRNTIAGTIRVSTIYSVGLYELPSYLKKFLREYPKVNVRVEYRHSRQVYEDVADGSCDVGIVAFPVVRKGMKAIPFRTDRLIFLCHPQHPLAKRKEVELEEIARHGFVGFTSDMPTRKGIDQLFRDRNLEIRPVMEFDNIETVKRAVEINIGVSIVPAATVAQEVLNGSLSAVEIAGEPHYRPIALLYKSGRILSPAVKRFLEVLQEDNKTEGTVEADTPKAVGE
ncbi:Transcriptional regulator, LysR/CysB family [Methylacidimicrobium sp. AP8]|uniref:LysR family transcriptional regulator n=1 Tax=Methylacidimicrobium sp. AP8 TaxID=2730359 RepID=UPI0018C19B6C|nr:LysR family transcriptional regulator [Methylacidimicrobium sp. AP8]CAB4242555.1 Transcriptional regulator, LysR/CysB family [Methylacidimicrobium sp. AP8]